MTKDEPVPRKMSSSIAGPEAPFAWRGACGVFMIFGGLGEPLGVGEKVQNFPSTGSCQNPPSTDT